MSEHDRHRRTTADRARDVALGVTSVVVLTMVVIPAAADAARSVEASGRIDSAAVVSAPAERVDPPTTPTGSTPSATLPPPDVPTDLVTGFDATPPSPTWTRPALFVSSPDPAYGSLVRRMTSADGTRFDRNTYSRRQAENADGTMFFTYHGDAVYRVYDRASGDLIRILDIHPDSEPQWHPTDPDAIRHIAGSNSYVGDLTYLETSVGSGQQRTIADLTTRVQAVFPAALYLADKAEGSPSADGNRLAWMVHDGNEDAIGIVSYDLADDEILGTATLDPTAGRLDWVSASPTGEYVMAGYVDATVVLDADLTRPRRINDKADHSDIALTAAGRDAYVYIDFSAGADGGWLMSVELDTLARTRLFDLYDDANTSVHVSGKGYDRPGWVVVSTYNCKVPGAWSCEKVFAVELATGLIVHLAHTYNCGDNYWTETHAVVNRSFTRVFFNSDAGSCGIDAEVYEIEVPPLP